MSIPHPIPQRVSSSSPVARAPDATRARLLDAAERLFAERGFGGTSMRALAGSAGTSVSAANYHFGSKRALLRQVLVRRLEPINRRRLDGLSALESRAGGEGTPLEQLLDVFLRPSFEAWREADRAGTAGYRHIAAMLHADPHEAIAEFKVELFRPVLDRFVEALARSLPGSGRNELRLGLQLVVGMLVHVVGGHTVLSAGDGPETLADEDVLARLIRFASAGLRAGDRR